MNTATTTPRMRTPLFTAPTSVAGRCLHLIRATTLRFHKAQQSAQKPHKTQNAQSEGARLSTRPNTKPHISAGLTRESLSSARQRGLIADYLLTRGNIAELTGFSPATVSRCIKKLLEAGLVEEVALDDLSSGRPKSALLATDGPTQFIGIHTGLRETLVASLTAHGKVLHLEHFPTRPHERNSDEIIEDMIAAVYKITSRVKKPIAAIGFASSGSVAGDSISIPAFGWTNVPLASMLHEHFPVPITVAPHVAAMAAHELYSSSPITIADESGELPPENPYSCASLYVYAREQIGVAWTMDGRVHLPRSGEGDIGHLPTAFSSSEKPLSLQTVAGDQGIIDRGHDQGLDCSSLHEIIETAHSGDVATARIAQSVLETRAIALGNAITWAADLIAPDFIVLAGAAFHDDPTIVDQLRTIIGRDSLSRPELRLSQAGSRVTLDAAKSAALDEFFHNPLGE